MMQKLSHLIFILFSLTFLNSCETAYIEALEKIGIPKREQMIDRIMSAQAAQEEGQAQFSSALEQFKSILSVDGGDLETVYDKLNDEYEDSVAAAERISDRIQKVEAVSDALFDEWQTELGEYSSARLRRDSEAKFSQTQRQYKRLIQSMHRAEKSIEPVLASLKDNVLYLKHNLNARAISSLKGELGNVNQDVKRLLDAMANAIKESNTFIDQLKN